MLPPTFAYAVILDRLSSRVRYTRPQLNALTTAQSCRAQSVPNLKGFNSISSG